MGLRDLFKSNFARIAENTTKYYLELKTNCGNRFCDEIFLLATAGVLDAQNYIFVEHSIEIDTIIDMARKAVSQEGNEFEQDPLFNFIFSLEVALFTVDNPRFSSSDIELACFKKANTISNAIRKSKEKYGDEARFALVVGTLMESPEFRQVRKQLGIKD